MIRLKPKKCKVCASEFIPRSSLQKVCSPTCAIELVKLEAEKKRGNAVKTQLKANRAKIKQLDDQDNRLVTKKAQTAFNSFVRIRDQNKPCISSGKPLALEAIGGGFDCGHYRSVGSAPHLRFHLLNAHGQSKHDNRYLSGNHVEYRKGLIERLGVEQVEQLEADNRPRKYTLEQLKRIADIFNRRARLYAKKFR